MSERKGFLAYAIFLFLFLPFANALYSQSFLTKTYSITDGLASATIYSILQDLNGVMWFATERGVSSYDGTSWKNYSQADGLTAKSYYYLLIDSRGTIWAFPNHLNQGFSRFSGGQWTRVNGPGPPGAEKVQIKAVTLLVYKGKLFIGIGTEQNGFYIYKNPGWMHFTTIDGINLPIIRDVDAYNDSFYLATDDGLGILPPLEPKKRAFKNLNTPAKEIYSIAIEKGEIQAAVIWLTGYHWIGFVKDHHFHLLYQGDFPGYLPVHYSSILSTLPDGDGGLWVGIDTTLLNIDAAGHIKNFGLQNDLVGDGAYCLFYDREANFWIGGFRGISKIVSFRFANFYEKHGLFGNEVSAVTETPDGRIVLGHNGGISFLSEEKIDTIGFPGVNKNIITSYRVLDLDVDRAGNVWAAVNRVGILKITPAGQMINYRSQVPPGSGTLYSSVRVDHTGTVWATCENSIFRIKNNHLTSVQLDKKVNAAIRRLFKGKTNRNGNWENMNLATDKEGLYCLTLKENKLTQILPAEDEGAKNIFAVYTDQENHTWVGTRVGLYTVKENRLEKFSLHGFQVDNPVYFITEDRDLYLWFGLDNGVIRWDRSTGAARHFTARDGLAGHETNRAAGFVDSRGRLWIGTAEGLSCYRKEKDEEKKTPPLLELLYLEVSGVKHPLDRPISVDYRQNDLTFHFRGISFTDETALRYHMKLEGYDNDWIRNFKSIDNQIRYTNIPPGHYTFHIQTVNDRDIESKIVSSPVIFINNPWWKTPVFYLFVISVFAALLFNITKYISKRRYAAQLEIQVRERTRELELSRKYFSNIFENAHDAIILLQPEDEVVLDVNQRACELYGFDRSEFIGMSMEKISKDVEGGKGKIEQTLEKGTYLNFETVQYRKDGSEMFLEINASVITYKGKQVILSINRDITERKRVEQEIKNSLQEKEILLKEIHHRVKNNLQIILSLLDLQVGSMEDVNILRMYQDSKNRIRSMALIHENLYQSEDLAHIDMEAYIESLIGYLWGVYGTPSTPVSPHLRVEDISLGIDMAIPIGLILTELFSNALKYAFPSGRRGEIFIKLQPGIGDTISLVFRDNGVGFPPDVAPHSPQSLGLQLVNLLTQQLNGTVDIAGSAGVSFTFTFPHPSGPGKKE